MVSVVVATPVNKNNLLLRTRVHTILLQPPPLPLPSHPPPEKEEEKERKKKKN